MTLPALVRSGIRSDHLISWAASADWMAVYYDSTDLKSAAGLFVSGIQVKRHD
jgi:hypothetical protein